MQPVQGPGARHAEEIAEFCSATYGVTFPMTEKVEVNGTAAHPLYQRLTERRTRAGEAGEVQWNFEKFLIDPAGEVVARFRPKTPTRCAGDPRGDRAVLPS